MADYLASDYHLFHFNICGPEGFVAARRRFENPLTMNQVIVFNHNQVVTDNDTTYFAGDLAINAKPQQVFNVLKEMKGQFVLVLGNHDSLSKLFKYLEKHNYRLPNGKMKFVLEPMGVRLKRNGVVYMITHYPLGLGERRKKLRNFHGHIHDVASSDANHLNICIDSPELPEGHPFGAPVALDAAIDLVEAKWLTWFREPNKDKTARKKAG